MKAIRISKHGSLDVLKVDDIEIPKCNSDEVLINIKACALNHLDIWVRNGLPGLPINLPLILGSDASGKIVDCGSNIKNFKKNDDVVIQPGTFDRLTGMENYSKNYGILGETCDGVQAEYIVLKEQNIHKKSNHLTYEQASSMQLVFMTAYQMIVKRAKLTSDENILVYGATSGVGSAAIQISKDIGSTVVATVGSKSKEEYAYDQGADYVFIHDESLKKNIFDKLGKLKFDVVFEHIGESTWNQSLSLLNIGGRIVTCGSTTGSKVNIDLRHLFMKQQSILGSTMADIDSFISVMKKIDQRKYVPFVDKVFNFSEIKLAHKHLEDRNQFGKIIVTP
tara:strand:- start:71 stop:1081 length:1011 start_codon:yes stop_codon:yes gene_type:complete